MLSGEILHEIPQRLDFVDLHEVFSFLIFHTSSSLGSRFR